MCRKNHIRPKCQLGKNIRHIKTIMSVVIAHFSFVIIIADEDARATPSTTAIDALVLTF